MGSSLAAAGAAWRDSLGIGLLVPLAGSAALLCWRGTALGAGLASASPFESPLASAFVGAGFCFGAAFGAGFGSLSVAGAACFGSVFTVPLVVFAGGP